VVPVVEIPSAEKDTKKINNCQISVACYINNPMDKFFFELLSFKTTHPMGSKHR
jgi:hypothetical protein